MILSKTEPNKAKIEELFKAGAHFGLVKSRRHPSAMPYIFGKKNNIEIFDLEKTVGKLEEAKEIVKKLGSENKQILFVGGKRESQSAIKDGSEKIDMPYVSGRWIGGTLTNFEEIRKRVKKYLSLVDEKEKGTLARYTKKERLLIDREMEKLEDRFGGLINMEKKPSAVFVVDAGRESIACEEAKKEGITTISLCSSDCDLSKVNYPIPGNDSSIHSIKFFINEIVSAYEEGKKMQK